VAAFFQHLCGPAHQGRVSPQHPDQIIGLAAEGIRGPLGLICLALMVCLSLAGPVTLSEGGRCLGCQALGQHPSIVSSVGLLVQGAAATLRDRFLLVELGICLVERVTCERLPALRR
jgi:hypothetical protein